MATIRAFLGAHEAGSSLVNTLSFHLITSEVSG
jgi:hypothetical protein